MKKGKRRVLMVLMVTLFLGAIPLVWAMEGGMVNINTATVDELMSLKKVGKAYAERIVSYRQDNGSFEKPEDIMKVKGIGPKTFELNKDRIVVK